MDRLATFLGSQRRGLATVIAAVMVFNGLLAVSRAVAPEEAELAGTTADLVAPDAVVEGSQERVVTLDNGDTVVVDADGNVVGPAPDPKPRAKQRTKVKDPLSKVAGFVNGVSDDEILVVYYWKGERTMTSPFVNGTGAEGQNLDEEVAFKRYIEFINKHADGSAEFMGTKINLHGRKLRGIVLEAGNGDFSYGRTAEKIAEEIKPFAAISSHGSLSAYICGRLAEAKIFNLMTYDLGGVGGSLSARTDGYCLPSGLTWERQVDLTEGYLLEQMKTKTALGADRVYGVVYATYPGLKDAAPVMIERFRKAGIPIAHVHKLPPDLANAQTHAQDAVLAMKREGVNTILMPDAGAPITFTHAAEAQGYNPDYYVWPCSGQDQSGMVRLFSAVQWEGAEGLTCYDHEFNPDLVNNDKAKRTEWWKQYQEMAGSDREPPSAAANVYAGIAQLLIGITEAGPNLTNATFNAALDRFEPYRYDAIDGRTDDPTNMLLRLDSADRSWIGDAGKLYWSNAAREQGGATQGAYVYPDDRRYSKASQL